MKKPKKKTGNDMLDRGYQENARVLLVIPIP